MIYEGQSYPIDFLFITRRSLLFHEKQNKLKNIENIDNGIEIPEEVIKDFISFCHFKEINITNSNVISLHQLILFNSNKDKNKHKYFDNLKLLKLNYPKYILFIYNT